MNKRFSVFRIQKYTKESVILNVGGYDRYPDSTFGFLYREDLIKAWTATNGLFPCQTMLYGVTKKLYEIKS